MSGRGSEAGTLAGHAKALDVTGTSIADLVLVRIAAEGGATRNMVTRDLAPYVSNKLSPAEWRQTADDAIDALADAGMLAKTRGRLRTSAKGRKQSAAFLNQKNPDDEPWQVLRDIVLVAKALELDSLGPQTRKALAKPEGLRALIVQQTYALPSKKGQTAATLRARLAMIALEGAFGTKIKSGLGPKANLPAKASRVLAGQLLDPPREFSTDMQLISHVAADAVGARQTNLEELRLALICRLSNSLLQADTTAHSKAQPASTQKRTIAAEALRAANDTRPTPLHQSANGQPDAPQFSRIVNATAAACAEGWPGNLKAYISRVWQAIRSGHPEWTIDEDEFKAMLVEAHRAGHVVLAGADLKNKTDIEDVKKSATAYKNTVWHFIRVDAQ